jgi:hypothetical protein
VAGKWRELLEEGDATQFERLCSETVYLRAKATPSVAQVSLTR